VHGLTLRLPVLVAGVVRARRGVGDAHAVVGGRLLARGCGRGVTVVEERDLWDMPIVLIALLVLLGAEWGFRRVRGLA